MTFNMYLLCFNEQSSTQIWSCFCNDKPYNNFSFICALTGAEFKPVDSNTNCLQGNVFSMLRDFCFLLPVTHQLFC